jgi:hypothetical protein
MIELVNFKMSLWTIDAVIYTIKSEIAGGMLHVFDEWFQERLDISFGGAENGIVLFFILFWSSEIQLVDSLSCVIC